jgi:MscS family membrane protein
MLSDFLEDNLGQDAADMVTKLLVVAAILLLTWLVRQIVSAIVPGLIRRITQRTATSIDNQIVDALLPPVRLLVNTAGLWAAVTALEPPDSIQNVIGVVMTSVVAYVLFWAIYRLIDPLVRIMIALSRRTMRDTSIPTLLDERLAQIIQQIVKALVIILGIAVVFESWGYSVSGLIAGLGLGGLAIALAAQNTLENLLGYFVILADEPFRVGEYVVFGDVSGTIESIGFRTTRIRALDQALVMVPNKTIMNANVSNTSRLTKRRLNMTLNLSANSSPDQILAAVQSIRDMLKAHPLVQPDSVTVQFVEFGQYSLDILIICFMNTPAWGDFQAARQDINLKIIEILDERGIEPAVPAWTVFLAQAEPAAEPARPFPPPQPEPALSTATDSPVPDDAAN